MFWPRCLLAVVVRSGRVGPVAGMGPFRILSVGFEGGLVAVVGRGRSGPTFRFHGTLSVVLSVGLAVVVRNGRGGPIVDLGHKESVIMESVIRVSIRSQSFEL